MAQHEIVRRHRPGPGPSAHHPGPPAARSLAVRQILHGDRRIQRTQIDHVHPASGSAPDHFLYELDGEVNTFSRLAELYGVSPGAVERLNPGRKAGALHAGDRIKVPAVGVPAEGSWPVGPPLPAIVQNISTHDVDVRWSSAAGSNRIGTLKRGEPAGPLYGGVVVDLKTVRKRADLLVAELSHLRLAGDRWAFGFMDPANVRVTLPPEDSSSDVNLIARMIWGEQRGQGEAAMTAAAWVARNRFDGGWGSYEQILAIDQFQGVVSPEAVTGLSGADLDLWNRAQAIARQVFDGTLPDPTDGALYFGNGQEILDRMTRNKCARRGTIAGTNFHYSQGDYTASKCPVR